MNLNGEDNCMQNFFKTFLMAFSLVFIMTSTAQADCSEGYYQIEQNSVVLLYFMSDF